MYYYRASPDGQRILFGGRVSFNETDPRISGPRLHADMVKIFPELATVRISHSWMGFVAYTFDEMMRAGEHDGIHYAMGYCGSGAGMAGYLGMRVGQQVLGLKEGATAFDDLPFPTRPFYTGNPWFLHHRSCTTDGATASAGSPQHLRGTDLIGECAQASGAAPIVLGAGAVRGKRCRCLMR